MAIDNNKNSNNITFHGSGPFHLNLAQDATARAVGHENNGVTITFRSILDGCGPEPKPVSVQLTNAVALKLAEEIGRAVGAAGALG
jgi:hypothetical protein